MAISREQLWAKFTNRGRLYATLLLLILPTFAGMILFDYYPKWETIKYSFYTWDASTIKEYRGLENFKEAFLRDKLFWPTFKLVGILLAANVVKMWPCIFTAVVLHRLRSERWQYFYRVMFVIPMVIPAVVGLLIWKSFYDPTTGILNKLLNGCGMMDALRWLDTAAPALASWATPIREATLDRVFGGVWGLALFSAFLFSFNEGWKRIHKRWLWLAILLAASLWFWGVSRTCYLLPVVIVLTAWLGRTYSGQNTLKGIATVCMVLACATILTTMIWTEPTKAFTQGTPAWLGNSNLIIPSVIFWGFPWIGTIGVLIYLAGLQNISEDVYEAAELDGVGPFGKLFKIELPLILTQVRINLIFMTIGTLLDYGLFYLLLGPEGGPGNKGMVPGLYMFREGFYNQRFGYACALGMVMFVMVLAITIFYQRYVKVEK